MSLELIQPDLNYYRTALIQFMEEFRAYGETRFNHEPVLAETNFEDHVKGLLNTAREIHIAPGYVPQTTFWTLLDNQIIIGTLRIRHDLTPHLETEDGHIGYHIRPSYRRRRLGTAQLALGLEKAKTIGLEGVLITCDTDNPVSTRIIVKNGGKFINGVISPFTHKPVSRYWIQIDENSMYQTQVNSLPASKYSNIASWKEGKNEL